MTRRLPSGWWVCLALVPALVLWGALIAWVATAVTSSAETVSLSAHGYSHADTATVTAERHVATITYRNNAGRASVSGLWPMPGTACTLHVVQTAGPEYAWLECGWRC